MDTLRFCNGKRLFFIKRFLQGFNFTSVIQQTLYLKSDLSVDTSDQHFPECRQENLPSTKSFGATNNKKIIDGWFLVQNQAEPFSSRCSRNVVAQINKQTNKQTNKRKDQEQKQLNQTSYSFNFKTLSSIFCLQKQKVQVSKKLRLSAVFNKQQNCKSGRGLLWQPFTMATRLSQYVSAIEI